MQNVNEKPKTQYKAINSAVNVTCVSQYKMAENVYVYVHVHVIDVSDDLMSNALKFYRLL